MGMPVEIESNRDVIAGEVEKLGAELVDIHFRRVGQKSTITFVVDKAGGITLDECVIVNRALSALFDTLSTGPNGEPGEGLIGGSYYLEVNSPGLDRPLKGNRDFARACGQRLRVIWRDQTGRIMTDVGKLVSAGEDALELDAEPSGGIKSIPYPAVVKAVREISFKR
jgi:ribosome maturation factor RimP